MNKHLSMDSLQAHCAELMLALLRSWRPPRVQVEPNNPGCTKKKKLKKSNSSCFYTGCSHSRLKSLTLSLKICRLLPHIHRVGGWRWGGAPQILKVRGNTALSEQQAFPVKSRQRCEYSDAGH